MPAKKKVAKKATKKVTKPKSRFSTAVTATPTPKKEVDNTNGTWATIMKKPRSIMEWSARQLGENKID